MIPAVCPGGLIRRKARCESSARRGCVKPPAGSNPFSLRAGWPYCSLAAGGGAARLPVVPPPPATAALEEGPRYFLA
jgi:hypothetical protein